MLPVTFDESRRDVSFPVRPRWSLAVDDLFGRFAPWAKQIYETRRTCGGPWSGISRGLTLVLPGGRNSSLAALCR